MKRESNVKKNQFNKVLLGISLLVLLFAGQEVKAKGAENPGEGASAVSEEYLEQMLDAMENRNLSEMQELWPSGMEADILQRYIDGWDGRKVLSYEKVKEEKRPAEGDTPSGMKYQYLVECEDIEFKVNFSIADEFEGKPRMDSFQFRGEMNARISPIHWLMVGLAVMEFIFTVYTARCCWVGKEKNWVLWSLLILFFYGGITATMGSRLKLGASIGMPFSSEILTYPGEIFFLKFQLPVGSFLYWLKEKRNKTRLGKEQQVDRWYCSEHGRVVRRVLACVVDYVIVTYIYIMFWWMIVVEPGLIDGLLKGMFYMLCSIIAFFWCYFFLLDVFYRMDAGKLIFQIELISKGKGLDLKKAAVHSAAKTLFMVLWPVTLVYYSIKRKMPYDNWLNIQIMDRKDRQ